MYPDIFPYKLDFYDARTTNFLVYYISVLYICIHNYVSKIYLKYTIRRCDVTEGNNKTILMRETFYGQNYYIWCIYQGFF